jgi:hypothetical protein
MLWTTGLPSSPGDTALRPSLWIGWQHDGHSAGSSSPYKISQPAQRLGPRQVGQMSPSQP